MEEIDEKSYVSETPHSPDESADFKTQEPQPDEPEAANPGVTPEDDQAPAALAEHVLAQLRDLQTEMQGLRRDFDTKLKYDASKGQLIDSLHSELQDYRAGLHFKILRPLLLDLIAMYDDLSRLLESPNVQQEHESALPLFHSFLESTEEILHRNGVESFQLDEPTFVASKQRVVKVIPTADPSLDKHIARRVRKGFLYEEKVLRPEMVDTYKFDASLHTEV
uniref:Nucleotide exchange factor GrpE n=1 Tax=Thermosporothrix sp. COM3 TaxID=2490863 RepID=A0A455SJ93_9CHLR|nr:hypothetical protein KTC_17430 [Thermosporothrix sp. COM3]